MRRPGHILGDTLAGDARWSFRGTTGAGRYALVMPTGQRRELDVDQAAAYLAWRDLAEQPAGAVPAVDDALRRLLTAPAPLDRSRLAVWAALEASGVTLTELATRVGLTRKSVSADLTLGRPRPRRRHDATHLEAILAAACAALGVKPLGPGSLRVGPLHIPVRGRPEPTGVARLRAVATVQDAGLLELAGPCGVHSAFRARRLTLARGDTALEVDAADVTAACAAVVDALAPDLAEYIVVN
jgi:hypothetical protein